MDGGKESGFGVDAKTLAPARAEMQRGGGALSSAVKVFSAVGLGCWRDSHLGGRLPYVIELCA